MTSHATPTLQRGQGVALWRQIAAAVERQIADGTLAPGGRLPTEAVLSQNFAVNRHTVRRAMEELEGRGLIRVEQGRGSFVAEDLLDYPLGSRTRFSETIRRQNREPAGRILRIEEVPADPAVAEALGLRRGRPVLVADRLALADDRPLILGSHYFVAARLPGLVALLGEDASITRALGELGHGDYRRRSTRITARMPTLEEATLLQQARTRPVLVTESINVDRDGGPLEYGVSRYAAGRTQLVVES